MITQTETAPERPGPDTPVVLDASDIVVEYRDKKGRAFRAVDSVSLELRTGETLGLVGESGCGKSSTGRALVQLPPPSSGRVVLDGQEITGLSQRALRPVRRRLQLIFQDPISSLNPRRTALQIVAEPLLFRKVSGAEEKALAVLAEVGVDEHMAQRRPHELSGGQCQRVSIARAIVQDPDVVICDEPVSALDVSVQAQVLNLLEEMKRRHSLSMVFISHDLAVISNVSDRVAVMYRGRLCEVAPSQDLYAEPRHPYTWLLLSSVPNAYAQRPSEAPGPEPHSQPGDSAGCPFAPRCPAATRVCWSDAPEPVDAGPDHTVACHHPRPVPEHSAAAAR
ncbi:ABC transporter ATP-binding protein [Streptomyces sp. NPDC058221]|uniref:ABC transporter ATP-binding protein n=1 Tax=Streptomyces sp. NPDC058221 TaxID=3346388 RepID=UPI0036EBE251